MAKKRKSLSLRARFDVFKRDRFTCQYCGRKPPDALLEVDHIDPVANGGSDDDLNLITSCFECNRGKADGELTDIPDARAAQIADMQARTAQTEALSQFLIEERARIEALVSEIDGYWISRLKPTRGKSSWGLNDQGRNSIRVFLKSLSPPEIKEAMEIAASRFPAVPSQSGRTWRYFCGICWKWIKEGRDG